MKRSALPDLIRSTAVLAMIANHLAVRLAAEDLEQGAWRILFQLGSFAPALFFFTTGFGYGLQAERSTPPRSERNYKPPSKNADFILESAKP